MPLQHCRHQFTIAIIIIMRSIEFLRSSTLAVYHFKIVYNEMCALLCVASTFAALVVVLVDVAMWQLFAICQFVLLNAAFCL